MIGRCTCSGERVRLDAGFRMRVKQGRVWGFRRVCRNGTGTSSSDKVGKVNSGHDPGMIQTGKVCDAWSH